MGIEVMAVLMKLLANARREGDTTTGHQTLQARNQEIKNTSMTSNSTIILYKIGKIQ